MVLCLISMSLNNFEFIFIYGIRECFNFADLHVVVQLSQHHLLKRDCLFSIAYFCPFCQRLTYGQRPQVCGFTSELSILSP